MGCVRYVVYAVDVTTAALRFFKSIVLARDPQYNRNIVTKNWLEPVMKVYEANIDSHNMVNSCVLELFDIVLDVCHEHAM